MRAVRASALARPMAVQFEFGSKLRISEMKETLYDLDPGPDSPELVRMIVEIPKNSTNKYEYDKELGLFRLDRTLPAAGD